MNKVRSNKVSESDSSFSRMPEALAALGALDETIHQKVRLGIMSMLLATNEADFKLLKETLALSDGNLSTHLALLEERGFIESRKEFVRKKPHTTYVPTEFGRNAFQIYLKALERIIQSSAPHSLSHTDQKTLPALAIQPLKGC